jgi:hypothetical protein
MNFLLTILASLTFSLSTSQANAGSAQCSALPINGTWQNAAGDQFRIQQTDCTISVTDLKNALSYETRIDGSDAEVNQTFFQITRHPNIAGSPLFNIFGTLGLSLQTKQIGSGGKFKNKTTEGETFVFNTNIGTIFSQFSIKNISWILVREGDELIIDSFHEGSVEAICGAHFADCKSEINNQVMTLSSKREAKKESLEKLTLIK